MRSGVIVLSSLLFLSGIAVGIVLTGRLQTQAESEAVPGVLMETAQDANRPGLMAQTTPGLRPPVGSPTVPNFADVAEGSVQAVANISSRQVVRRRSMFADDPFFRYFFGNSRDFSGYRERLSLGSGVIGVTGTS